MPGKKPTKDEAPFLLVSLQTSKEFLELTRIRDSQGSRRTYVPKRKEYLRFIALNWAIKFIVANHANSTAILTCLKTLNQALEDIRRQHEQVMGELFDIDHIPLGNLAQDMHKSPNAPVSEDERLAISEKFPKKLDARLSVKTDLEKELKVVTKGRSLIKKADPLSEIIVNLYNKVATVHNFTVEEKKQETLNMSAGTPTPTTKKRNAVQTLVEFNVFIKYYQEAITRMDFASQTAIISKKDIFEYAIARWIINFLNSNQNLSSIQKMLSVALEASEEIQDKDQRVRMLTDLNENIKRNGDSTLGKKYLNEDNACLGDLYILFNNYIVFLQKKLQEKLNANMDDAPLNPSFGLSEHIAALRSKVTEMVPQSSRAPLNVDEQKTPQASLNTPYKAPAPDTSTLSVLQLTGYEEYKKLDASFVRLSEKTQNKYHTWTVHDLLNFLTISWVVNFIQNPSTPKDHNTLLNMLRIAHETIHDMGDNEKLSPILANLKGGPLHIHNIHELMVSFPQMLASKWEQVKGVENKTALNPQSDLYTVGEPQDITELKRKRNFWSAILSELHQKITNTAPKNDDVPFHRPLDDALPSTRRQQPYTPLSPRLRPQSTVTTTTTTPTSSSHVSKSPHAPLLSLNDAAPVPTLSIPQFPRASLRTTATNTPAAVTTATSAVSTTATATTATTSTSVSVSTSPSTTFGRNAATPTPKKAPPPPPPLNTSHTHKPSSPSKDS